MWGRRSPKMWPTGTIACRLSARCLQEVYADKNQSFCKQDEDHDPGEGLDDYMACIVCGDNGKFSRAGTRVRSEMGV